MRSSIVRVCGLATAFCLSTFLGGCATSVALKASDRAALHEVELTPTVTMPVTPFYHGPAQSAAALLGPVGALVANATAEGPAGDIVKEMAVNHIDLASIVKEEFVKAAGSRLPIRQGVGEPADAKLTLKLTSWGLAQTQGLATTLYPMMHMTAVLSRPDGTVLWQRNDFATPLNGENKIGYTYEEYMSHPEYLSAAFHNIAGIVSRMIVADLGKS